MGNKQSYLPVTADKKDGTTLISLQITSLGDAHGLIGSRPDNFGFTPVVLMPQHNPTACCCFACIPSGFTAIVTRLGGVVEGHADGTKEDISWSPGCHCFNPFNRVEFLVTKQLVVFDAPVKECKTKDAITISLDIMIVFEIFQASLFVWAMGAEKFDDFLRNSQDEAIRSIAIKTPIDKVQDLRGSDAADIIEELNKRFGKYGVKVHSFTVKNVRIPPEMANDAEAVALFDAMTTMRRMNATFDRLDMQNDEGRQKLRDECDNARNAKEQQSIVVQNQAVKATGQVITQTQRDIEELISARDMEVQQVIADSGLEISRLKSTILQVEREKISRTEAEVARIMGEAGAFAKQKETEASITAATCMANGKSAMGMAEGEAASAFVAKRAYEADLKRLEILKHIVVRGTESRIATSQENTVSLNPENAAVTAVVTQGLEALRAKLAEITVTSLAKLEQHPKQMAMH